MSYFPVKTIQGCAILGIFCAFPVAGEEKLESYPDGTKKAVYRLDEQGRKQGFYNEYWPNGKRKIKASYRNDKLNGSYRESFKNGGKKIHATYADGKLHGPRQVYEVGQLVRDEYWFNGELLIPRSHAEIVATMRVIERMPIKTIGKIPPGLPLRWVAAVRNPVLHQQREAALRLLMAYRFLCHVPFRDLELDVAFNARCEASCEILQRLGVLTHAPQNPGMLKLEYRLAHDGCANGNLSSSANSLVAVNQFMSDSDATNINRLGHRRWCLNPVMKKTGFASNHGYTVMWATDGSRSGIPEQKFTAFPPNGLIPTKFFSKGDAWSIMLSGRHYQQPTKKDTSARIWPARFIPAQGVLQKAAQPLPLNYFNVNDDCVIFRPATVQVASGATYIVEIAGIKDRSGKPAPIVYLVSFL